MTTNLVIAAHPDDEVLGVGGIIKKFAAHESFFVLILTRGAEGRYDSSMETVLMRQAQKANAILGTKEVFFADLPNQGLDAIALTEVIQVIETHIAKLAPERIFTHHGGDLNKDHRIVFQASLTAARPLPGQVVRKIYTYNVPSSTEWQFIEGENVFIPTTYVDIQASLEAKVEALSLYESECRSYPHPRSPESIRTHAHYWGLCVGSTACEPLRLVRDISGFL